jgi:hypothetical protein
LTSWNQSIHNAPDQKALAALVNDYLAMWSPHEMERVPVECRPDRIRGIEDIEYWRGRLSNSYCSGAVHDDASAPISRLIAFFTAAAERLAVLDEAEVEAVEGAAASRRGGDRQQPRGD